MEKVDDPQYCKGHQFMSHLVERCFVLEKIIIKLAKEEKLELELDEIT